MNPDLEKRVPREILEELIEEGTEAFRGILEKLFNVAMQVERSEFLGAEAYERTASRLRQLFEALSPPPTEESAADYLMWSPSERPIRRTWVDKKGKSQEGRMTDLEVWFREFGDARNTIIHKGEMPELMYPVRPVYHPATGKPVYHGRFFFTAEFMLRGAIKALLTSKLGYKNVWRSELWRTLIAEDEEREHQS